MGLLRRLFAEFDDRTGLSKILGPIARHPVPPGSKWWYVFGSATLFAFILLVVTGIFLSTTYIPSTGQAYDSLRFITNDALFGHVVRGLHYFGASAMILLIGIHTIQVFLFGCYKYPREMNWLTGALLMPLVLGMAFTGQLLRWDQDGIWSVIVGAEQASRLPWLGPQIAHFILSGDTVGGATLSRFFAVHVFFIPAIIFALLGVHLFLVMHHGISEPPKAGEPVDPKTYRAKYDAMLEKEGVPFWPDAAWRDVVFGAAMIAVVVVLAWLVGPPALGKPPDPTILRASPRPDWPFLWYFAVLSMIPPQLETLVILTFPVFLGFLFLILPFISNKGERSPLRRPWAVGFVLMVIVMIGTLWRLGQNAPWSPDFSAQPLSASVIGVSSGPVYEGAHLFYSKGCEYCHAISGQGGLRGPDLSDVADRMTPAEMTLRILSGRGNMPAFAAILKPEELNAIVAFLKTRTRAPHPAQEQSAVPLARQRPPSPPTLQASELH